MAELRNELNKSMPSEPLVRHSSPHTESDLSDEAKTEAVQAEHERLLNLQQKMNQKLRDLELSNEEARSLLRAALLDKDSLSPELLQLKKEETLRRIREQIQDVIKAPSEAQPKVLDATSSDIAETVLASQAALDSAKKVSAQQLPQGEPSSSPAVEAISGIIFKSPTSTARSRRGLDISNSAATLVGPSTPARGKGNEKARNQSMSVVSASTASTTKIRWEERIADFFSPTKGASAFATGDPFGMHLSSELPPFPKKKLASCSVLGAVEEYTYPHDFSVFLFSFCGVILPALLVCMRCL